MWLVSACLLLLVSTVVLAVAGRGDFSIAPSNLALSAIFGVVCAAPVLRR